MTIPRELLRSKPRSVELTGSGRVALSLSFLLVVVALVGGPLMHEAAIGSRERVNRRVRQAVAATGVIRTVKRDDGKWRVNYVFTVGGRTITGKAAVKRRVEPQARIPIFYSPSDPEDNWTGERPPRAMPIFLAPVFGVLLLVVAGLLQLKLRRDRFLLENGRAAVAVARGSQAASQGEAPGHATQFEYRTLSGGTASGTLNSEGGIAVGTEFIVVFDSDQPTKLVKYPLSMVRIAE